jgi:hypothetical protein
MNETIEQKNTKCFVIAIHWGNRPFHATYLSQCMDTINQANAVKNIEHKSI